MWRKSCVLWELVRQLHQICMLPLVLHHVTTPCCGVMHYFSFCQFDPYSICVCLLVCKALPHSHRTRCPCVAGFSSKEYPNCYTIWKWSMPYIIIPSVTKCGVRRGHTGITVFIYPVLCLSFPCFGALSTRYFLNHSTFGNHIWHGGSVHINRKPLLF